MRLINADAAIAECNKDGAYGYISASELMELPTIDLVRCGECKHYTKGKGMYGECEHHFDEDSNNAFLVPPCWFCADGERRADDV